MTVYESRSFDITEMTQPVHGHLLRAETGLTLLRVDVDRARKLFHRQDLWEGMAAVFSYHTGYLFYRDGLVVQQRTYSMICNHLEKMILLSEKTHTRVSILDCIQDRTHLSRSNVLSIVSALKKEGYIDFEHGEYLASINKLPERF